MFRTSDTRTPARLSRLVAAGALLLAMSGGVQSQPTNPVKLLKGVVTDARSGKPVDGGRIFVYEGSGSEPVAQSRINPSTGAFQVVLNPSGVYRFVVRSPRFLPGESTVRTPAGNSYEEVVQNLTLQPIPVGESIYAGRAFDNGAVAVTPSNDLARAIAFLKESQSATVRIAVAPDAPAAKAESKKSKKGKKVAVEAAPESSDASLGAQAQARIQAMRGYLQREGISLTRVTFEAVTSAADARAYASRKQNMTITIAGIDVEEIEED